MKTVLLHFYSSFKKLAVLSLLIAMTSSIAFAQNALQPQLLASNNNTSDTDTSPAPVASAVDRSTYGTFTKGMVEVGKKKKMKEKIISYTSFDGVVIKLGDQIKLLKAKGPNGNYAEIRFAALDNDHLSTNPYTEPLAGQYVNQRFTVTAIASAKVALFGGGPKIAYVYFDSGSGYYEISVEAALASGEFEIVK